MSESQSIHSRFLNCSEINPILDIWYHPHFSLFRVGKKLYEIMNIFLLILGSLREKLCFFALFNVFKHAEFI